MTLTLYNTLTRRKEPFRPIDPANVRMYVCGPTVYDYAHIGNARPVIVFDVLFRLLRHIYGEGHVTYARNITDVDDKINARAAEEYPNLPLNEAIAQVTRKTEQQFHEDTAALGVLPPTVEPRATEYIRRSDNKLDMVRLIEMLLQRGHAYVAQDHVLFDVSSMPEYGRLANRSLEEMEARARVDVAPYKKGPMDFVLWKPSKQAGVDGSNVSEPAWPSPCGIEKPGRPGWHIECSAMAGALLGETFDIHGGGIDLVFPHHENELAQTCGALRVGVMANYWLHNGFLQVEGEKMSKSLGNFVTINELLDTTKFGGRRWPGEVLRLAMLMTHYRQPIDWTQAGVLEAAGVLRELVLATRDVHPSKLNVEVTRALNDDLNTPAAIGALHQLKDKARAGNVESARELSASLVFLGLLGEDAALDGLTGFVTITAPPDKLFVQIVDRANGDTFVRRIVDDLGRSSHSSKIDPEFFDVTQFIDRSVQARDVRSARLMPTELRDLILSRNAARKAKDFKEADRIRDELSAMGIQLKDAKDPATGEIVTTWEVRR